MIFPTQFHLIGRCEDVDLTEDELFVGKVLFQVLNVCPCNSHDISEIETPVLDR